MFKWTTSLNNLTGYIPSLFSQFDDEYDDTSDRCMHLCIYRTDGGHVVEVSKSGALYIITDDKDLGKELGKIVTLALQLQENIE